MDYHEIFLKLLLAETEEEIEQIIVDEKMNKSEYWKPYGDNNSNYSIIGAQASFAERGLVEKITNAIDALLTKKCIEAGIDPKGPNAPKTPQEALEKFYGIEDGNYSNMTKEQEEKISKDLYLFATSKDLKTIRQLGRNSHINLSVYDGGEGQTPKNLPNTILSLIKGNKKGIPFTQGRYNQGGSGAMLYCGENGYSLIVSRRHPDIINNIKEKDESFNQWGWTLTRMEMRPDEEEPVFTYFAPDGKVPRFNADSLPLKPSILRGEEAKEYLNYDKSCSAGIPYNKEVSYGTLIKLYNYDLKQKGPLISHFKYTLGRCMLDTYLPVSVVDCRKNKYNNIFSFQGLVKVLDEDKTTGKPLVNEKFPIYHSFYVRKQKVKLTVYGFNYKGSGKKNVKDITGGTKPIFLTLGQQFQGGLSKAYISNSDISILKDWLLIIIEFPDIDPYFKKDLFMTDRERLADKWPKEGVIKQLKAFLNSDSTLEEFASEKMEELIKEDTKDNTNMKSAMESWINNNPEIMDSLNFGDWYNGGNSGDDEEGGNKKRGKGENNNNDGDPIEYSYIPTYFNPLLRKKENQYIKKGTKGNYMTIRFETDAPVDFFDRPNNTGKVKIKSNNKETEKYGCTIKNGIANINFRKDITKKTGKFKLEVDVTCEDTDVRFNYDIVVSIEKPKNNGQNSSKGKLGLPKSKNIYKEDWEEHEMDERTGALFHKAGNKEIYLINMDNIHLQKVLENIKKEGEKEYYKNLYRLSMILNGIAARNDVETQKSEGESEFGSIDEAIKNSTKNSARTFYVMDRLITDMRKKIA